jgi:hypothetical protein
MSAANDSVDPSDPQSEKQIQDLAVPEQSAEKVVGGSTTLSDPIQMENADYTVISNIMKTKHDTATNSISNVR